MVVRSGLLAQISMSIEAFTLTPEAVGRRSQCLLLHSVPSLPSSFLCNVLWQEWECCADKSELNGGKTAMLRAVHLCDKEWHCTDACVPLCGSLPLTLHSFLKLMLFQWSWCRSCPKHDSNRINCRPLDPQMATLVYFLASLEQINLCWHWVNFKAYYL